MSFNLSDIVGGNLGALVKDVVGTFHLSPEKQAEFQSIVDQNAAQLAMKQLELDGKVQESMSREIEAASANIQAEAKSGDKYTSRARPTFMYVFNIILLMNYVVLPQIRREPVSFPDSLFWLGGACILGYTGARSWDKWAEKITK